MSSRSAGESIPEFPLQRSLAPVMVTRTWPVWLNMIGVTAIPARGVPRLLPESSEPVGVVVPGVAVTVETVAVGVGVTVERADVPSDGKAGGGAVGDAMATEARSPHSPRFLSLWCSKSREWSGLTNE